MPRKHVCWQAFLRLCKFEEKHNNAVRALKSWP